MGIVLEDFTLSLVRVHTFFRAELEVERNTTKALKCKKISGELFFASAFCCSSMIFVAYTSLYPHLYQDLRRSCPGIPGGAIRGWASSSWYAQNEDISILIG
jgi:hypothetical protein